jgi:hypothetical protein
MLFGGISIPYRGDKWLNDRDGGYSKNSLPKLSNWLMSNIYLLNYNIFGEMQKIFV